MACTCGGEKWCCLDGILISGYCILFFFNQRPRCLAAVDYVLFGVTAVRVPGEVSVLGWDAVRKHASSGVCG